MPLILIVDTINIIKWWVDASYVMHPDCWIHTREAMSLGRILVASMYKRQIMNPRISTKAKMIGADKVLPELL